MNDQPRHHITTTVPPNLAERSAAAYRDMTRAHLDAIAAAVQVALREADLVYPVFFSVPSSGQAILTFATPLDPAAEIWDRVSAIIRGIVSETTGLEDLQGRHLPCAVAAGTMSVADLLAPKGDAA